MTRRRRVPPREPPPKDKNLKLIFEYCLQKPNWAHQLLNGSNEKKIRERMIRMFSFLHFEKVYQWNRLERNEAIIVNGIGIKNNGRNVFKFIKALGAIGVHVEDVAFGGCCPSISQIEKICDTLEKHCRFEPRFLELQGCPVSGGPLQLFVTRQLWQLMVRQATDPQDGRSWHRIVSDWLPPHNYHEIALPSHEPFKLFDEIINETRPCRVFIYNYMTETEPRVLLPSHKPPDYELMSEIPVMPLFYNELFETYRSLCEIRVYAHREEPDREYSKYRSVGNDDKRYVMSCLYYPEKLEVMEELAEPQPTRMLSLLDELRNPNSESAEPAEPTEPNSESTSEVLGEPEPEPEPESESPEQAAHEEEEEEPVSPEPEPAQKPYGKLIDGVWYPDFSDDEPAAAVPTSSGPDASTSDSESDDVDGEEEEVNNCDCLACSRKRQQTDDSEQIAVKRRKHSDEPN